MTRASCEKCWRDSGGQGAGYGDLVRSRKDNPCTPEEQAGPYASKCPECKRMTLHQHTDECMAGCVVAERKP